MSSLEKSFRGIEAELDQLLESARSDIVALGIEINDHSVRRGRDAFTWSYQFDSMRESEGLIRRVYVWLSYMHPWTPAETPPVEIHSCAQIFQRGSAINLREWKASSAVALAELKATGLNPLLHEWICKGKEAIGETDGTTGNSG